MKLPVVGMCKGTAVSKGVGSAKKTSYDANSVVASREHRVTKTRYALRLFK